MFRVANKLNFSLHKHKNKRFIISFLWNYTFLFLLAPHTAFKGPEITLKLCTLVIFTNGGINDAWKLEMKYQGETLAFIHGLNTYVDWNVTNGLRRGDGINVRQDVILVITIMIIFMDWINF